jgi:hypothetical protein
MKKIFFSYGSGGRTRTYDPAVNSRLLYQLSYAGMLSICQQIMLLGKASQPFYQQKFLKI